MPGHRGWHLADQVHDSCFTSDRDTQATSRGSSGALSTITSGRDEIAMPQDSIQGLYFMLGLLLAFYLLMPFLELSLR